MEACRQVQSKHALHEDCLSPLLASKLFLERGHATGNVIRSLMVLLEDEDAGRIRIS